MSAPVERWKFSDTGEIKREKENFQNFLFENIDLSKHSEPISFFRSDFRGSKVINSHFYKNNFDRADFIDSYVSHSTFEKCCFGTDFINTYFSHSNFIQNTNDGCSIVNCTFNECNLSEEVFTNCTIRDCVFINCTLQKCKMEMNTVSEILFDGCTFNRINLAHQGAYNFKFNACQLSDVIVDPDYIGSYLFKETDLTKIRYQYRGADFNLNSDQIDNLKALSEFYSNSRRYYEAFNLIILINSISPHKNSLLEAFKSVIVNILSDKHALRKFNNLNNVLSTLEFYCNSNDIETLDFIDMLKVFDSINQATLPFKEYLTIRSKLGLVQSLFEDALLSWNSNRLPGQGQFYSVLEINEEELSVTLNTLDHFFTSVAKEYFGHADSSKCYSVVGTWRGSFFIEIIGSALAISLLGACIKKFTYDISKSVFVIKTTRKANKLIDKANNEKKFKKSIKLARLGLKEPTEETKDKATKLASLLKDIQIFTKAVD